jgi:hypothetical protein
MNQLVVFSDRAPTIVAAVGERASYRFLEFFTDNIRNPKTRRTYARAGSVQPNRKGRPLRPSRKENSKNYRAKI